MFIQSHQCFMSGIIVMFLGFILHCAAVVTKLQSIYRLGRTACYIGGCLLTIGLGLRWKESGFPPLSNMYESLVTLGTFFVWLSLIFTRQMSFPLIEAGVAVISIISVGIASLFSREIKPLVPALQSYWLHLHVSLAFLGEACFAISFLMGYLYCFRKLVESSRETDGTVPENITFGERLICLITVFGIPLGFVGIMTWIFFKLSQNSESSFQKYMLLLGILSPAIISVIFVISVFFLIRGAIGKTLDQWLPSHERLDELIYQTIALGYPLFTVGAIIFGMIWANKAWGRYWGWDPKETWALITFLVYSVYLHVRLTKGWRGTHTAFLSVIGFLATLFTLFGVNLLLSGLHAYASN